MSKPIYIPSDTTTKDVMWEQFEYIMEHNEDQRFCKVMIILLEPFRNIYPNSVEGQIKKATGC